MEDAVLKLKKAYALEIDLLLVDGRDPLEGLAIKCENIVKGDRLSLTIAAASVIAKVGQVD